MSRYSFQMPYAIGDAGPEGEVIVAALEVRERIAERGRLLVLVAPSGSVYAVLARENKADVMADKFPAWVAGWYDYRATVEDIAGDLRATYEALQVKAKVAA